MNTVVTYPETVEKAKKVELLLRADEAARAAGSSIVQVSAGYGDSRKRILVANSDGLLAEDDQVRTLFRVSVVVPGRRRDADGLREPRAHDRVRAVRPARRRGAGPAGRRSGPSPSSTPGRRRPAACPW